MMKCRIFSCILVLSLLLSACAKAPTGEPDTNPEVSAEQTAYDHAMNLLKSGDYEQARITLLSIKDYKDAADHLADLTYLPVSEVRKDFVYEGSQDQIQTVTYTYNEDGVLVKAEGKYAEAKQYLAGASAEAKALADVAEGNYAAAKGKLTGYNAAVNYVLEGNYSAAQNAIANDKSAKAEYLRAVIAAQMGKASEAAAYLKNAIKLNPALKAKAAKDVNFKGIEF